jgi:exodeoxyribonuclease V alpha subunit
MPSAPKTQIIEGRLERITYHNEQTHYTVAKLQTGDNHHLTTVVGHLTGANLGERLKLHGRWEHHSKYGPQFRVDGFEVTLPQTAEGIRRYLASGIIKGLGEKTARRIVDHFKADTFGVIEETPQRLTEIKGIGPATVDRISEGWQTHHEVRTLLAFLQSCGVSVSYSGRLLRAYGSDALQVLKEDPYQVAEDIPGVGFFIADSAARKQGLDNEAPERIRACIRHLLNQHASQGHIFMHDSVLYRHLENRYSIDMGKAAEMVAHLVDSRELINEMHPQDPGVDIIYLDTLYRAESMVARRIKAMLSIPAAYSAPDKDLLENEILRRFAVKLSDEQYDALQHCLTQSLAIITGGPGTGKTTLIRAVVAAHEMAGKTVCLAAPTGRAAKRLSEVVRGEAQTLHRLLRYNAGDERFEHNRDTPLQADVVVVDEASMVDIVLMQHLLEALSIGTQLLLVGDAFQLPSVGPGSVLSDLIQSRQIPTFKLNTIFRQALESPIVLNAHRVRKGELPQLPTFSTARQVTGFDFIEIHQPAAMVEAIVDLCTRRLPALDFDPFIDIQVLTPMHKGDVGTLNLNRVLQARLNAKRRKPEDTVGSFSPGDKVMHLRNNYVKEVFNGDIGTIAAVDRRRNTLKVVYENREVGYGFDELEELTLAYAISVHKSQGSEYPAVVVPLTTAHYPLLQRNLIYTALTRARELAILVGMPKALNIAVQNNRPQQRLTTLKQRLQD